MFHSLAAHLATTILLGASPSPFADVFVDLNAPGCMSGNGSAGSPVCSISAAVAIAMPGDSIRIAPGTYVENVIVGIDLDLIGTGGAAVTIVDGGASGSVVTIASAVTVTIDGLTIQNGAALNGAGINLEGNLTLTNSTITDNHASGYYGGGIGSYAGPGTLLVEDCTISGNTANYGGGIAHQTGVGSLIIRRTTIDGNQANYYGGGVYTLLNDLVIEDSTISNNSVVYGYGAGIEVFEGSLTLTGSTLSGNNSGGGGGGGFEAFDAPFLVSNCTISGNAGYYGSGINTIGTPIGSMTLSNVTIANNTGGGVNSGASTNVEVRNSIIALNTSTYYLPDAEGLFTSLGYNLVGEGGQGFTDGLNGDQAGAPGVPLDPIIGPLADNGGPTWTHELLTGSPAIDSADPMNFEPVDQRGTSRPLGSGPDIGAFESDPSANSICNGDGGDQVGCTPCPCGNDAPQGTLGGCINSGGTSTLLIQSGSTSIAAADLRFEATGTPPAVSAVLTSGNSLAPANVMNPCFGQNSGVQSINLDGLRCAVQGVLRHGVRPSNASGEIGVTTNGWGTPNGFFNFAAFSAGGTKHFQIIHRDDEAQVCTTGQNTSQAISVTFVP